MKGKEGEKTVKLIVNLKRKIKTLQNSPLTTTLVENCRLRIGVSSMRRFKSSQNESIDDDVENSMVILSTTKMRIR